jgi:hypothetical protein
VHWYLAAWLIATNGQACVATPTTQYPDRQSCERQQIDLPYRVIRLCYRATEPLTNGTCKRKEHPNAD